MTLPCALRAARPIIWIKERSDRKKPSLSASKIGKKDKEKLLANIEKEMREAAKVLDFERAAELRDILLELRNE